MYEMSTDWTAYPQGAGGNGRAHDGDHPGQDAHARESPETQARQCPG